MHFYVVAVVFWLCGIFIISICSNLSYHDGEDVLRSALVVQSASRVDDSVVRVDAEEPHAAGVNTALEAKGQTVDVHRGQTPTPEPPQYPGACLL